MKTRSLNMKTRLRTITPSLARDWLKKNTCNRKLDKHHVDFLAKQILAGDWIISPQTISFDDDMCLLDGQHRLHAIAEAGRSVECLIITGADRRSCNVIDQNMPRSNTDVLYMYGYSYSSILPATIRLLEAYAGISVKKISNMEMLYLVQRYDNRLEDSLRFASTFKDLPNSVAGACHYIFSGINEDQAAYFFEKLASGCSLDGKNPILAFRDYCLTRKHRKKISNVEWLRKTIHAWNDYRQVQKTKMS